MRRSIRVAVGALVSVALGLGFHTAPSLLHTVELNPRVTAQAEAMRLVETSLSSLVLSEAGVLPLLQRTGLSGRGVTVGLVDTGVDPSVLGVGSLVDFVDLTTEGLVSMSPPLTPDSSGAIDFQGSRIYTHGVSSVSGTYRLGYWSVNRLPAGAPSVDALRAVPNLPIMLADGYLNGQYDTVYVDTDGDNDFSDERGLEVFRNSRAFVQVSLAAKPDSSFALLVSDIEDNGSSVTLGFDAHGHGTAVASILAGSREGYQAVSPSASVILVKALDSTGEGTWSRIADGIAAAIDEGATIVIVSASARVGIGSAETSTAPILKLVRENPQVLVIMSAGNAGPGVGTLLPFGHTSNLLLVGGHIPGLLAGHLNMNTGAVMWPWSSRGPAKDGTATDIVAPALAPALYPAWSGVPSQVPLFEGTSCSAAYVGGVSALLAESLGGRASTSSASRIKKSLQESAIPIPGTASSDQGYGMLRADQALEALKAQTVLPSVRAVFQWNGQFVSDAFFDRDRVPGHIPMTLDNLSPFPVDLEIQSPAWLQVPLRRSAIAAVDQREIALAVDAREPGIYSDFVEGVDRYSGELGTSFLVTAIVPRSVGTDSFSLQAAVDPGEVRREFFRIPPGLESFRIALHVDARGDGSRGRASLYAYDGSASLVHQGAWIGAQTSTDHDIVTFDLPTPGVWEVVVVGDPAMGAYGTDSTLIRLDASPSGVYASGISPVLVAPGGSSEPISWLVDLVNPGPAFSAETALLADGLNGFARSGLVEVAGGRSATIALPQVGADTAFLRMAFTSPVDKRATLDAYVYFLDTSVGQWKEIASTRAEPGLSTEIVLSDPQPGRYVAYVDLSPVAVGTATFRWSAMAVRQDGRAQVLQTGSTSYSAFQWAKGSSVTVQAKDSAKAGGIQYLMVWDASTKEMQALIPITPLMGSSRLLVTLVSGGSDQAIMNLTLRAWEAGSLRPVDACVEVDGTWYQTSEGRVSMVLPRKDTDDLSIRSEYPGMIPWIRTSQTR